MEQGTGILVAGLGWTCAGVVILLMLYIEELMGVNSGSPYGAIVMGAVVVAIGAIILVSRKKISNIIDSKHK